MKNLKKVLALALATVMMFGMMVVGASAAYKDQADITRVDATGVMTAIGAIKGDGESYNPGKELCRADAALIATRVALGAENAEKLGAVSGVYSDITADFNYASGAIAWATENGLIAGDGTGKFNPGDPLAGIAFAKMLLVALGYDASIEGYVNNVDWAMNINYDAMMAGLLTGLEDVNLISDVFTREQAAIMAFNAVTAASKVTYNEKMVIVNGELSMKYTVEKTGDMFMYDYNIAYVPADYDADDVAPGYWAVGTYAKNADGSLKLDGDGAPIFTEDEPISGTEETVEASFKLEGKQEKLADGKLKGYTVEATKAFVNGAEEALAASTIAAIEGLTDAGKTVRLYANNKVIYKVEVSFESLVEVKDVKYVKTDDVYTFSFEKLAGSSVAAVTYVKDGDNTVYDALCALNLEKGDVLLVNTNKGNITNAVVAESNEGLTSALKNGVVTIGGVEYPLSFNCDTNNINLAKNQVVYTDSQGNALYITDVVEEGGENEAAPEYLYVVTVWYDSKTDRFTGDTTDTYSFSGFNMKGEAVTGTYTDALLDDNKTPEDKDDDVYYAGAACEANAEAAGTDGVQLVNAVVEYKLDKDGNYVFVADQAEIKDATIEAGKQLNGKFFSKSVEYLYVYTKDNKLVTELIPGVQSVGQKADADKGIQAKLVDYFTILNADDQIVLIVVEGEPNKAPEQKNYEDGIVFIQKTFTPDNMKDEWDSYTIADDAKTLVSLVKVLVDGKETKMVQEKGKEGAEAGFYQYSINEIGVWTLDKLTGEDVFTFTGVAKIVENDGEYYVINEDDDLCVANDAVIYNLDKDATIYSVSDIMDYTKDGKAVEVALHGTIDKDGNMNVVAIYVTSVK